MNRIIQSKKSLFGQSDPHPQVKSKLESGKEHFSLVSPSSSSSFPELDCSTQQRRFHQVSAPATATHTKTMLQKTIHECVTCKATFPCSITLKVHGQEHTLPNVQQISKSNRDTNNSKHNQLLCINYVCQICNNSFPSSELLSTHSNIHLQGHKCQSEECQRLYKRSELKVTISPTSTHPSNDNVQSTAKTTSISNQYQKQIQSAINVQVQDAKPDNNTRHKADDSHQEQDSHRNLEILKKLQNQKQAQTQGPNVWKRGKCYPCKICHDKILSSKISLKRHYLSQHKSGEIHYRCNICGSFFADEQFWLIHAQVHFSREIKKAFVDCRICGRRFPCTKMYKEHSCRYNAAVNSN